jgi:hypothetical protein
MLHPASAADLGFIRSILIEGAAGGSFDPELATRSSAAALFFANLDPALRSGYLRVPDDAGNRELLGTPAGQMTRVATVRGRAATVCKTGRPRCPGGANMKIRLRCR